jgi:type I restriction enzyme, S subunit
MSETSEQKLGELATYINGRGFKPHEWSNNGLPIIRIANLNNPAAPQDYFQGSLDEGHLIKEGDILVSWSATLDAFIWNREPAALNQHIFKVIPNEEKVDKDFLFFVLKQAMAGISELVHGATMKHINKPAFEAYVVRIPKSKNSQIQIAAKLKAQLAEAENAIKATEEQILETENLANAIIYESIKTGNSKTNSLGDVLDEVKKGIGKTWQEYLVLGATRNGLALAKEPPGKKPERYKPIFPGTVFYNPMRILIGSIAFVDDDDTPGITSPDYVALKGKEGVVDSRWFYYWLRSQYGKTCINSLARGAVRERMLFNRLADGKIELPEFKAQQKASEALKEIKAIRINFERRLKDIELLPNKLLIETFEMIGSN